MSTPNEGKGGSVLLEEPPSAAIKLQSPIELIDRLPSLKPRHITPVEPVVRPRTRLMHFFPSVLQIFVGSVFHKKKKKKRRMHLSKSIVVHEDTQKIIKTVDVYEFKTGGAFAKDLRDDVAGFTFTAWAREIVSTQNPFFKIRKQRRNDLYMLLTPADLGFQQDPQLIELRDKEHLRQYSKRVMPGYELHICPDDIALYLLKRFELDKKEMIFPVMEPICNHTGETASYTSFVVEAKKPGSEQTLSTVNPIYNNCSSHIDYARLPINAKLLYRFVPTRVPKGKKPERFTHHGKTVKVKLNLIS